MDEHMAKQIVSHFAEIGCTPAETGNTRGGVACTSAGGFDRRTHALVEKRRAIGIDQVHGVLDDTVLDDEIIISAGNDIDNGVAYAKHVKAGHENSGIGLFGTCWRLFWRLS
jgi:hypothetical protein